ncbi:DUF4156 domain-containing protein [Aeromonas veronii]
MGLYYLLTIARGLVILSSALVISACVTATLTENGSMVRMTSNSDAIKWCDFIGNVEASDHFNGGLSGQAAAEENAVRTLRNKTAEMGGDTVTIMMNNTGFSGSSLRGEAYRCNK